MNVKIEHKGEDYYGIDIDGEYIEVSISEGSAVENMIKAIQSIVGYHRR